MSRSVYFNGELITIPGAYSAIDTSNITTKTGDEASTIALIGTSMGGEPGAVQFFDSPSAARKTLKGGELLKACEKAWNPVSSSKLGVAVGGAQRIACIRANKATKSSLTIEKTAKKQLEFESKDWGAASNVQIKVDNGSLADTKRLTVFDTVNNRYEQFDNLGNVFGISYTGNQKYAELNVFIDSDKSIYFQTKLGNTAEDAVEDIRIKLDPATMSTIQTLISRVKSHEGYLVSTVNAYNTTLKVSDLDFVSKANIKDTADHIFRVTAVYADMQSKLADNSQLVQLKAYDKSAGVIDNFEYKALIGGTEGEVPASWIPFFDKLSNFDIDYIVPLTGDEVIHAELSSHVTEMSGALGMERRAVVGGNAGESISRAITRAAAISNPRVQVVCGGFYDMGTTGELELFPPYILAAAHAGRAAFLTGGESATHDVYAMAAPEIKLERSEIVELLNAGVLAFEFVVSRTGSGSSFVRLVQDLTTYTMDTNPVYVERSVGALADSINKELRLRLDTLLTGRRATESDMTTAANAVISVLSARKRSGDIIDYKDVSVSKTGTVVEVDYGVAPSEPNNFTLITAHYYDKTISATGATE